MRLRNSGCCVHCGPVSQPSARDQKARLVLAASGGTSTKTCIQSSAPMRAMRNSLTGVLTRVRSPARRFRGTYAPGMAQRSGPAAVGDVHELALAMPHVTVDHGTQDNPVYQVGGKSFIF